MAAVGTFALHWLTRGVWTWVVAVLLAILWLAGAAMLVSALRNRPGFVTIFASRVVRKLLAIAWPVIRLGWWVIARVVNLFGGISIGSGDHATAAGGLRVTLPTDIPPEWKTQMETIVRDQLAEAARRQRGPWWQRAVKGFALIVVGALVSWVLAYYLPAPSAATANVTTPPSTSTTQPHAPHT